MKNKKVVITFARMNGLSLGHLKLFNKMQKVADDTNSDLRIYLSHSEDPKKNPITYKDKIKFAKKAFGSKYVIESPARTIIEVLKELEGLGYSSVTIVIGQDRLEGPGNMKDLVSKYNGKDYHFDSLEFVSSGDRDPNAKGVEGMSGSKMRELAASGNFTEFAKGTPLKGQDAKDMYNAIRKGLQIKEAVESLVISDSDKLKLINILENFNREEYETKYGNNWLGIMLKVARSKI